MERYVIENNKEIVRIAKEVRLEKKRINKENWENRKIHGVGVFVNYPIAGIINRKVTNTYSTWAGMVARCYDVKRFSYPRYGGRGVTVDKEWHNFQNFAEWYESQYREPDWHLDKDILFSGEIPIYQPLSCVLVPGKVNVFFSTLPIIDPSVSKYANDKGGFVNSTRYGIKTSIKASTIDLVCLQYWKIKAAIAFSLAQEYEERLDIRVIDKLRNLKPPVKSIAYNLW